MVDHPTPVLFRHHRRGGTSHQPRAELVHREHLLEVLVAGVEVVDVVVEGGVVHEDVDRAERVLCLAGAVVGRVGNGDVGGHEDDVALALQVGQRRLAALLVVVGDDDLGALAEEAFGVGLADALARAGDDGDAVLQTAAHDRWMRLNRSVRTGSPVLSSFQTVSETRKVMVLPLLSFS